MQFINENQTPMDVERQYMRYLKLQRNYSPNTLEAYRHDLDYLLSYCRKNDKDPLDMKLEDLQHFAATIHEYGVGASSQARILSGVRSFYRFLVLDGFIEDDPTELLESPHLGVRVSELVNLKLTDLYLEEGYIRVLGKGSKERLVPISPRAIHELKLWFYDRNLMNIKRGEEDYVFLNRRGSHLTRTMILIMIKRQAEAVGIKKTISPHTLRHSFATALLKGGADLRAIQAMLGHEDIGTTEIYTHIDTTTLRKEILEHHPRNKKL